MVNWAVDMQLTVYFIDAFATKPFEGNPAAVCFLDEWLPDELMQSIAAENNLSETAFLVKTSSGFYVRWFTPTNEVDLCGHATLASAFVLFNILGYEKQTILFQSKSGLLEVIRKNDFLEMDFPAQPASNCAIPEQLLRAFDDRPIECLKSQDYIVVFENEDIVLNAKPNMSLLAELDLRGVAITARGSEYDFVTRFFAPKYGINEDPVTGSAFTQLIPYWSKVLNKLEMTAKQVSKRGGEVGCFDLGNRVKISGKAVKYMVGTIYI